MQATTEELSDLYIVVELLRNSFYHFLSLLTGFLRESLAFSSEPYDVDAVHQLWEAFVAIGDNLELLVQLNPVWSVSKLWVSSAWEGHAKVLEMVSGAMLYHFTFLSEVPYFSLVHSWPRL